MQALCQWDAQHDQSEASLRELLNEFSEDGAGVEYAVELVQGFWARHETIDGHIGSAATKWDIARISLVERNLMRVAVDEMLAGKVPPKVALHEAVELADEFGGAESPRFVNGVLDAVLHRLPT
jgi:N utilization substance protein B